MLEKYPEDLRYSESHAWVRMLEDGNHVIVGITGYEKDALEDINYIDFPDEKAIEVDLNEEIAVLELAGGSYEFYSPVSGELVEINEELSDSPRLIYTDPYGDGWICKIKLSDPTELEDMMSSEEYMEFITLLKEE